jgi:hypothetical protein
MLRAGAGTLQEVKVLLRGEQLIAFATPAAAVKTGTVELLQACRRELPAYMVPVAVVPVDEWPRTVTGKLDEKQLPDPTLYIEQETRAEEPPNGPLETRLRSSFDTALGREGGGVTRTFFELGGHSLSAGRLANLIRKELDFPLQIKEIYEHGSVRELAKLMEARGVKLSGAIDAAPGPDVATAAVLEKVYKATFQQKALYEMSQLGPQASQALNITFACRIRGKLEITRLRHAFVAVCMRHDALRSVFLPPSAEQPAGLLECTLRDDACLDFEECQEQPAELTEWILQEQYKTFDLHSGPLCRVRVLSQEAESSVLHWTLHHTAADLWSYTILLEDLAFAYRHVDSTGEMTWPKAAPQYRACAAEQDKWLQTSAGQEALKYWRAKLDPAPPLLDLPTDQKPQPGQQHTFVGSKVDFEFPSSLFGALGELGRKSGGTSAYPVLLAAWIALLSRLAQEEDICVGVPTACRMTCEAEQAVGYFVNPSCVRASTRGTFEDLVRAVSSDMRDILQYQCAPLAEVCATLGLTEKNLLQGMFVYQTSPLESFATKLPSFFMAMLDPNCT